MKVEILIINLILTEPLKIYGIYNSKKNILGMMPHPERMTDKLISNTDGLNLIFKFNELK